MFIADFVNYEKVFKLDEENGVNDDDDDMDVDEENQKMKKNSHNNKIKKEMWMLKWMWKKMVIMN